MAGTPFLASSISTANFVDFDHDLDPDLLVTGAVAGTEFNSNIYENLGNNNFVLVDSLVDVYLTSTVIGDLDGDDDLDVVISGISNQTDGLKVRKYFNSTEMPIALDADCLSLVADPIEETVEISGLIGNYTIEILDASENVVQTLTTSSNSMMLDTKALPVGLHFVRIVNSANGLVALQKIIKQ